MGIYEHCSLSNEILAYIIGEISEEEKNFMDKHLLNCSSCSREVRELQEAWDMISYNLEEGDVPDDLKNEVMQTIFLFEEADKPASKWKWPERLSFLDFPAYIWIAAALTVALVGSLWNNVIIRQQLLALEQQSQFPSQILQAYSLKSADPSLVSAKGNVWLFEQGKTKKLVFHLEGLEETKGTETYQVWLIQAGKRRSAGVFRVDKQGNGVLTYEMKEEQLPFEAIGITLEPDADGTQPRGKKVLGT